MLTRFAGGSLLVLTFALLAGCGGKQIGTADSGAGGDGGVFTAPDGATCVDIDLASYDQSCESDSDCVEIVSGEVCSSDCLCPSGSAINRSGYARYQGQLGELSSTRQICDCLVAFPPKCIAHTCTVCNPGSKCAAASDGGPPSEASTGSETSTGPDAGGMCVHIDPASFDQSCTKASDCIGITGGTICSGGCACGGATINKSGEASYEAALSGLSLEACPCVAAGQPECVSGTCTMCGFGTSNPPACPDGG